MYKIDFKSIFQKGITPINEDFGIFLICGYQGSGKGYFSTYNLIRNHKNKKCKTNVQSLNTNQNEIEYFTKIEDIYHDTEKNCVYIIDELSKKFPKNAPLDRDFYSWLQQCRKNSRYVYLITQEYINVPQWLRGVANMVYITSKVKFLPLFITFLGKPVLTEDMEWSVEVKDAIVYKRTFNVAKCYDTLEGIEQL
jgi:hypothetical protein